MVRVKNYETKPKFVTAMERKP